MQNNSELSKKLDALRHRAATVKTNPSLRHNPSERDLAVASENVRIMTYPQYQTIKAEDKNV
jgi:hypothetical protein